MSTSPDVHKPLREPVTLDTVIPPLPRKTEILPRPDYHHHEQALKALDAEITTSCLQLEALKQQIQSKKEPDMSVPGPTAEDDRLRAKKEDLNKAKTVLQERYQSLVTECRRLVDEQARLRTGIKVFIGPVPEDPGEALPSPDRIPSEIAELEISKTSLDSYEATERKIEENRKMRGELSVQLEKVYTQLSGLSVQLQDARGKLIDLSTAQIAQIPALKFQRNSLKIYLEDLKTKRRTLISTFREKEHAFKEQQKLIKSIDQAKHTQRRLKEQEERKLKQNEEEKNRPFPSFQEIAVCEGIIRFLERLLPIEKPEIETEDADKGQPEADVGTELIVDKRLREAQEGINWFKNVKTKNKKTRARKMEAPNFQLPVDMLAFLAAQSIKIPVTFSDLPDTIVSLTRCKTSFENRKSAKKSPKKPEPSEDGSGIRGANETFPCLKGSESAVSVGLFPGETPPDSEERREARGKGRHRGRRGRRFDSNRRRESGAHSEGGFRSDKDYGDNGSGPAYTIS